jgi:hypothetical protein
MCHNFGAGCVFGGSSRSSVTTPLCPPRPQSPDGRGCSKLFASLPAPIMQKRAVTACRRTSTPSAASRVRADQQTRGGVRRGRCGDPGQRPTSPPRSVSYPLCIVRALPDLCPAGRGAFRLGHAVRCQRGGGVPPAACRLQPELLADATVLAWRSLARGCPIPSPHRCRGGTPHNGACSQPAALQSTRAPCPGAAGPPPTAAPIAAAKARSALRRARCSGCARRRPGRARAGMQICGAPGRRRPGGGRGARSDSGRAPASLFTLRWDPRPSRHMRCLSGRSAGRGAPVHLTIG